MSEEERPTGGRLLLMHFYCKSDPEELHERTDRAHKRLKASADKAVDNSGSKHLTFIEDCGTRLQTYRNLSETTGVQRAIL